MWVLMKPEFNQEERLLFSWCAGGRESHEGAGAVGEPFAAFFLGDPRDVVFEGRGSRAVGSFHAGDFAGDVDDGDVFVEVANVFNGAGVGGACHRAGLFVGKEFLDFGRAMAMLAEGVDEIAIGEEESGHEFGIVFVPGGGPFVVAFVDGGVF